MCDKKAEVNKRYVHVSQSYPKYAKSNYPFIPQGIWELFAVLTALSYGAEVFLKLEIYILITCSILLNADSACCRSWWSQNIKCNLPGETDAAGPWTTVGTARLYLSPAPNWHHAVWSSFLWAILDQPLCEHFFQNTPPGEKERGQELRHKSILPTDPILAT